MKALVQRDLYTQFSTQGRQYLDTVFECYTLEPPVKDDGTKPRAIPTGTYALTIRWSDRFQRHMPHIENVPGFGGVEQHVGNRPEDTEACTLVGQLRGPAPDEIGHSLLAWTTLMAKYLAVAVLSNPTAPERYHVWQVGNITFEDVSSAVQA